MAFSARPGRPDDLASIVAIQDAAPELSPWAADSLGRILEGGADYGLLVAELEERIAAFLLWRALPGEETEILSLAVDPRLRRRGAARALLQHLLDHRSGKCFLEVRASNTAASSLYAELGFVVSGLRRAYYHRPVEDALIMRRAEILPKDGTPSR